jgi:hypothetical protein
MRTAIPDRPDSSPDEGYATRCLTCAIDWPLFPPLFGLERMITGADKHTLTCPQCGETCDMASNLDPIPLDEAKRLKAHADFDRFYERRGERIVLTEEYLAKFGVD